MSKKRDEQLKEITERLEQGVKDLFTSERYVDYLKTMSQFHNYSFNNTLLIAMQKPDATLVAGYQAWQNKFNRHVKRGEKGIQIISPAPIRQREEVEKLDPDTREPVLKDNGQPETEEVEYIIPRFKVASVFDVTQTDGEPLPSLGADELTASVENYDIFMQAITAVSQVPIRFDEIEGDSHGYYHNVDKEIVIKQGMSESQTMKTAIHEVAHAKLHDRELMAEQGIEKNQMTREVEAESIAYTVCQHFGLDTSDYSFPYIAGWSSNVDMKELRTSMDTIRHTAGEFIEELSAQLQELQIDSPEKQHLMDDDLILKISASMESDYTYDVIRGMDREQLLDVVTDFKRLEDNDEFIGEPDLEAYLFERGAEVIPWYTASGNEVEYPVSFYDIEYDADTGITDAASLSSMTQAELLIDRAEYRGTLFNNDDRNLIVNYAYQFDNMEVTKALIRELAEAIQEPDLRAPSEVIQNAQAEIDALPDSMIGLTRMHEYGYENSGMLPLTKERALELYHRNLEIFCLYEDGTEATYDNEAAIHTHDGIYGIEKETWERYRAEEKVEQRIMEGQEEMFSIYQVRDDGMGQEYKFMGTSFLENNGMQVFREDYNLMYTDVLTENDTLDYIFQRFNIDRPDDFYGHSLSVSDVIVVSHNGEAKSYYVDSFGFTELPDFFKQREQEREEPVQKSSIAERIQSYDTIKDSIYIQMIPQEGNADLLEEVPHRLYYDMAIIYKIPLAETPEGTLSTTIKNKTMENYGITEEQLYQNALSSSQRNFPVKFRSFAQTMQEVIPVVEIDSENEPFELFMVTNDQLEHGAAAILYPSFMEEAAEIVDGSYYIIPASQDELLLLKDDNILTPREIAIAVHDINELIGDRKLSDSVFHYNTETRNLELVGDISAMGMEQNEYLPVFRGTLAEATEHGMADAYLDSRKLNMDCKNAIEEAISENFDSLHLNHGVVTPVLEEYGAERVAFVLADTLQHLSEDGRFSRDNKAWAERIHIPENRRDELDLNADYIVTSHPAVLDGFVNIFREEARERLEELDEVLTSVPEVEPRELAYEVGGGFLSIHETDGGYDYTFYGKDYLEIDGGVYDNPAVTIYKALEAVLEEEGYSLEDCVAMDYEELDAAVELEEETRFKRLQGEMNCPDSIFEAFENPNGDRKDEGVALKLQNLYMTIQPTEDGYDYIFYDDKLHEINGGLYENPDINIKKATREIIADEQMADIMCTPMNYREFEEMTIIHSKEILAEEVRPTSEIGRREAALNGQSRAEIEELVLDYAQSELDAMGLEEDVKLIGARVYGSRTREGLFAEGSDIDVVLSYEGDIAEDAFFNVLHEHGMKVAGMPLDVNPISIEKTGTMAEYLAKTEKYLDEKENLQVESVIKEPVGRVTFASGEVFVYTDPEEYLKTIDEEIEYSQTSGFQYTTLSDDPALRKAVDDRVYNLIGENNPHDLAYYQETQGEIARERAALRLAVVLDELSKDIDTYEYGDSVEDREAAILQLRDDFLEGGDKIDTLKSWFEELEDLPEDEAIRVENLLQAMDSFAQEQPAGLGTPEKEATISFYVAECMEFPVLGQFEENLTMEEALKIYEQIPSDRMNGIKGVGFHLDDGSFYDGDYPLMSAGKMEVDMINCIDHYKESPLVQEAVQKMQVYLAGTEKEKEKTTVFPEEKEVVYKEPAKSEQFDEPGGKTIEAVSKPEPVQTQIKQPDTEKTDSAKKEGKKESVLKALRDRQAKIKSQEQSKPSKDKLQQNKKGDVEL
ncbi:MAG: DUF5688 family protein [Lachnospiraceae bacterium]|nr:DUF5688 family protein [Lachnospiraceae bacterium]